jgi:nucleotide-binding universal stress UspA family protein
MSGSIVVGTDGSDTATKAVREAVVMARALGATLDIVSAYAREGIVDAQATLADAAEIAREAGVAVNTHPRQGDPADVIIDLAQERDARLVIVGNRGMTGAKRLLVGSVPNNVAHHAPCSVLIVRTT